MASVRLEGLVKAYGATTVVDGVDLSINKGEFVTLLGASGSGKTTCLRMIAGFVTPTRGKVLIDDQDVTHVPAHKRDTGMVFQQYALFPHLTVAQNVAFGLKIRRLGRKEVTRRTREMLDLVRLEKLADRYPSQLSGGQKQRVALARAVVISPRVLLLDEPLGALDLKLREELQAEIKRVQETLGITAVFVTHDQHEALGMSDRIVIMRDGKILQVDTPTELYRRPNSEYVASFVGRMNFLEAKVVEALPGGPIRLAIDDTEAAIAEIDGHVGERPKIGARCLIAFRPEEGRLAATPTNSIKARLERTSFSGSERTLVCVGPARKRLILTLPQFSDIPEPGSEVSISWAANRCILLPIDRPAEPVSRTTPMLAGLASVVAANA